MKYERGNEGDIVFNKGDKGDKFYIILLGRVSIYYATVRAFSDHKIV